LGLAVYFLAPLLRPGTVRAAYAFLGVAAGIVLGFLTPGGRRTARRSRQLAGLVLVVVSLGWLISADAGSPITWVPFSEAALARATAAGRPVLIDVGADWCLPCREMERTTFRDPAVVRTAATLLAGTLKADERLSLEFSGNGPIRGILAEANPEGDARGFVFRPRTHLPARAGKLDVGGALGAGVLCVIRVPLAEGVPYRSIVPLATGEIGTDVASYLARSEQIPSAVGVGVYVEADGRVAAAGGYLLQAMPGADQKAVDRLEANVAAAAAPSDLVRRGLGASEILAHLLAGLPTQVLEEHPVRFRCR